MTADERFWLWGRGSPMGVVLLIAVVLLQAVCGFGLNTAAYGEDLHIDGTLPIGLDIPRIYVMLRRELGGDPLTYPGYGFIPIEAFLDTGASGMLISRDSADILGVENEPNAAYMDVGVGGWEEFEVSELLYVASADRSVVDPLEPDVYGEDFGPWRLQMALSDGAMGPLDIWGMPLMAGRVAVLDPTPLDTLMDYFHAKIVDANSVEVPAVDFHVKIRFADFVYASHPANSGPLPMLAYNPLIDSVRVSFGANESEGSWLLDTGATVSMISYEQAYRLGLTDPNGVPILSPDFTVPIGGVGGGSQELPGYQIDELALPMLEGFELAYDNPYVVVHNVGTIDEETGEPIILDGIFGTNFLAASATMALDIVEGPYNRVVIDTVEGVIGFDLKASWGGGGLADYCGDQNHAWRMADVDRDCYVGQDDLLYMTEQWLANDCGPFTWYCERGDVNRDGKVDLADFADLSGQWMTVNGPY